ncbi:MAG TPA: hypothetical protein VFD91_06380 [Mariniphaga sp.]|nr:hypothetical protein [Mariniphaga sp.]
MKINSLLAAITVGISLIVTGCNDSDSWVEEELNNTTCNSNLATILSYNNTIGVVTNAGNSNDDTFYIRINNPDTLQATEYCIPCNLPDKYKMENLRIRFNGDLKSMAGVIHEPGEEFLIIAQPITLTRLWVIE